MFLTIKKRLRFLVGISQTSCPVLKEYWACTPVSAEQFSKLTCTEEFQHKNPTVAYMPISDPIVQLWEKSIPAHNFSFWKFSEGICSQRLSHSWALHSREARARHHIWKYHYWNWGTILGTITLPMVHPCPLVNKNSLNKFSCVSQVKYSHTPQRKHFHKSNSEERKISRTKFSLEKLLNPFSDALISLRDFPTFWW